MARWHSPPPHRGGRRLGGQPTVGPQPVTPRWPPAGLIAEKFCGSKMPAGRSPRARITPEPASDGAEHDPPPGKVRLRSVERRGGRVAAYQPLRPGRQARSAPKAAPLPQPVKRARYLPGPRRRHHLRPRLRNMCLLPGPPMGRAWVGRLAPDPPPQPPRATRWLDVVTLRGGELVEQKSATPVAMRSHAAHAPAATAEGPLGLYEGHPQKLKPELRQLPVARASPPAPPKEVHAELARAPEAKQ